MRVLSNFLNMDRLGQSQMLPGERVPEGGSPGWWEQEVGQHFGNLPVALIYQKRFAFYRY